jgi:hypothetical protein
MISPVAPAAPGGLAKRERGHGMRLGAVFIGEMQREAGDVKPRQLRDG